MTNEDGNLNVIAYVVIAAIVVILLVTCICIPLFTQDTTTLTVVKTDSYTTTDCDSDNSCSTEIHNLVYTKGEILQFNDCIVLWVWGSQTMYSHIETGKTYTFKVYGFNVPWLNWYRSVISYEERDVIAAWDVKNANVTR